MTDTRLLELRLERLERHLELAKKTAGLLLWTLVLDGPSVASCRVVPDGALLSEPYDEATWPTFIAAMERAGVGRGHLAAVVATLQARVDAGEADFEIEYPLTLPDGSLQWRLSRGAILYRADGVPSMLEGVAIDITGRKASEERTRKLTESIEAALRGSDTTLWEIEVDGGAEPPRLGDTVWVVGGPGDLSGDRQRVVERMVAPEYREAMDAAITANLRGETEEYHLEYRTNGPEGAPPRWRFGRGRTIRSADGTPLRFVGTSIDITELKQAEQEKERATSMLELATRLSKVYVWRFDFEGGAIDDGHATFINVWESLGYDPKTAPDDLGASLSLVVLAEDRPAVMAALAAAISGEKPDYEAEYRIRHADGSVRWNLGRGIVTRDASGAPVSWIGTSVDVTAYKAVAEEARRYKERLDLSILGSKTCAWDLELGDGQLMQARVTCTNVFELLGYEADDTGRFPGALAACVSAERQAALIAEVQRHLDGDSSEWEAVYPVRHRDGSERWHLGRGVIQRDPGGQATRLTGISIDITERVGTESALRESELRFRATFETTAVGFSITSPAGVFLDCNESLCRLLGYAREELVGRHAPTLLFPDGVAAALERLRSLVAGEVLKHAFDERYRRKDGTIAWLNATFSVMSRAPSGRPERILGTFVDITARKALEEDLRRTKERLELGIRGSGTTIFDLEMPRGEIPSSTLTLINGWENFGYDPATATTDADRVGALLMHPEDRPRARAATELYLSGASPRLETEYRIVHADRSISWQLVRAQALRDEAGRPTRLLGSMVDITEMKRIEVELERAREAAELANRAKDEFLANVSHEIRTPMNAILGMTELALDAAETAHQRQLLSTVKIAARNLLHVINDLLDFSKITAGKLALDHADFSLRATIGDTLRALAVRAHRKGLELICHVQRDVPDHYVGDAGRVGQVLMNLVGNAIKFTARGEVVVEVAVAPDGRTDGGVPLRFDVRDTGIGIAAEKHAAIFHAFEQADASTTRKFGGTGLGLTISSQLAALMGGRIAVASEPGRGSTFSFTARIDRSVTPEWPGLASPGPLDGVAVLVVDDNATHREILTEWLDDWRLRPAAVPDAAAALVALERAQASGRPFGLVLLDGRMPGTDGIALAGQIRERFGPAAVRLVLMASDHSPTIAARSRDAGIHAYVLKPIQPSELLAAIWTVMSAAPDAGGSVPAPAPPVLPRRSRALYVLVAEDNELNVTLVRELLAQRGHSVEVAGDGRAALELATRSGAAHDVMLLDLHMPEMDGFEVVEAIRAHELETGRHLPIVALTARSSARDREKALAAGMDDFLAKPLEVEELWAAIERVTAAGAPPTGQPSRLLDARVIVQMCGGRPAVLDRLCEVFRRSVGEHLTATRVALDGRDLRRLRVAAHMLAGTLSAFSTIAGTLASTLEDAAGNDDLELCASLVDRLEIMCATLVEDTRGLTLASLA